ncbi:MAG: hypothetical protein A4E23_00680 [Methanomethylovorans sp. PtaU1.Bin073]|nr:MAG: hypothetical protein A4E23_00680 [Methanomethylovorans sp. PtaU1.Bin073]
MLDLLHRGSFGTLPFVNRRITISVITNIATTIPIRTTASIPVITGMITAKEARNMRDITNDTKSSFMISTLYIAPLYMASYSFMTTFCSAKRNDFIFSPDCNP